MDGRGTSGRTVVQNEQQEKGMYPSSASVGDLSSGAYFYKITTRPGVETKRFVKRVVPKY
ncbi:T9SS type A sorting domain-containing protein [Hymenobacter fastidiosus]|uniref:T9SS type A sorting domain-containing protein n=1 Tax=Hymenobacter fastidiosus TaxID=486264 RepID=UPI003CD068B4